MKYSKFDFAAIIMLAITISISTNYVQAEKKPEDKKLIMSYGYNGRYLHDSKFTPSLNQSQYDIILEYHEFIQFLKSKGIIMPQRSEINIIDKFCSHEKELMKNGFKGIFSEDQKQPLNVGSAESTNYKRYINQIKTVDEKNSNLLHEYTLMKIKEQIQFYNEVNYNISNCEAKVFQSNKAKSTFGCKAEKSTQYTLLIENFSRVQKTLKQKLKADEYNRFQRRVNLKRIYCHINEIFNSIGFTGIYKEDTVDISKRIDNSNFPRAIDTYYHFALFFFCERRYQTYNMKNYYVVKIATDIFKYKCEIAKVYDECKSGFRNRGFSGDFVSDKALTKTQDGAEDYELFLDLIETNSDFAGGKHLKNVNVDNIKEIRYININLYNKVIHAIPEPQNDLIHFFCHNTKKLKQIGYNGLLSHDIGYTSNYHSLDVYSTEVKDYTTFLENLKPGFRAFRSAFSEYVAYILAKQNRFFF